MDIHFRYSDKWMGLIPIMRLLMIVACVDVSRLI